MKHKSCHKLQNRFTAEQPSLSAVSVSEAPRNVPSGQVLPPTQPWLPSSACWEIWEGAHLSQDHPYAQWMAKNLFREHAYLKDVVFFLNKEMGPPK